MKYRYIKYGLNNASSGRVSRYIFLALAFMVLSGCDGFFNKKQTEVESLRVLKELSEVRESTEIKNPLPELYKQPPTKLEFKDGVKVFYFTRNHPAEHLARLITEQLELKSNPNSATNQLVVYCNNHEQADQVLSYLQKVDVPPVQVNINCLILERFGDITMDWETSILIQNLFGEEVTLGERLGTFFLREEEGKFFAIKDGNIFEINPADFPGVPLDTFTSGELLDLAPAFPGASLRETERSNFGLDFGYWIDKWVPGHQVRAVIDVLVSQGYLKILLNPTLETVNGQQARVTIKDYTPIEKVKTGLGGASDAYNITEYTWVEDTLTVTPVVYADGSIGLTTSIKIGSRSKPEGVVQRSIITERSIDVAENRVKPGQSLVIGGMRKSERRSVIRGIPFLKDIPILGIFFSSKDFEDKATEIIFILTPSISSGGRDHTEVVEEIRKKHKTPHYEAGLGEALTEPLGGGAYTDLVEKRATETEVARLQAEARRDQAKEELQAQIELAQKIKQDAENLRNQASDLEKKALEAQALAEKAAKAAIAEQEQSQSDHKRIEELTEQARAAFTEYQKLLGEVEKAREQAQQAEERANKLKEEFQQKTAPPSQPQNTPPAAEPAGK